MRQSLRDFSRAISFGGTNPYLSREGERPRPARSCAPANWFGEWKQKKPAAGLPARAALNACSDESNRRLLRLIGVQPSAVLEISVHKSQRPLRTADKLAGPDIAPLHRQMVPAARRNSSCPDYHRESRGDPGQLIHRIAIPCAHPTDTAAASPC
jgi:hypothetical protein